jgi:hypothetical protein
MTRVTSTIAFVAIAGLAGCSGKSAPASSTADPALVGDASDPTCGGKAVPLVLPVTAKTPNDEFAVTLTASDPPQFAQGDNAWTLRIDDADGKPMPGLVFRVVPYMTEHRHGAPKTVIVTEVGEGVYEAKPINANMPGIWDIRVELPAGDGGSTLRAVFSVCASGR